MTALPNYYTGQNAYTRLSQPGSVQYRPADSVGDYVQTVSGLGELTDPYPGLPGQEEPETAGGTSTMYFILTVMGSALAGGTVGYLSSGGKQSGAMIGAAVLGGITGIADAGMFAAEGQGNLALTTGFMSIVSLVGAFYIFQDMRGSKPSYALR